ncbi:MAG: DUF4271 domain-containing protein [Flavobacteriales bacterium]|nr:DUF4271 domain-containing protein [Flavobacteriales bacterium]
MISSPIYTSTGSSSAAPIIQYINNTNNLTIIGILISISILGIVTATDKNTIRYVFETILSDRGLNQNFKDKTTYINRSTLLLFFNYVLCISLLIITANSVFSLLTIDSSQLILIATTMVVVLFVSKRLLLLLSGVMMNLQNETQEYLFNHSVYTLAAGILLIPILTVLNFTSIDSEVIIQSSFVFLLLFIGLRLVKSISLALKLRIGNLFYIFLYICTLEILPLIVLYKAFVSKIV